MNSYLFEISKAIFSKFIDLVFIIFVAYLLCFFVAILLIKRRGKNVTELKLYLVYFILSISGVFLQTAVFISLNAGVLIILFYSFFYFSICLFLFAIISVIKKKKVEDSDEELLNRLIDEEIEKEELEPPLISKIKTESEKPKNVPQEEVDFTHVKNVMERLSYYDLSVNDKRQLRELKETVYIAESEGINVFLREKINDGLGNLLKIMSKHGV